MAQQKSKGQHVKFSWFSGNSNGGSSVLNQSDSATAESDKNFRDLIDGGRWTYLQPPKTWPENAMSPVLHLSWLPTPVLAATKNTIGCATGKFDFVLESLIGKKDPTLVTCKNGFYAWFHKNAPNPNVLDGAIVGGLGQTDEYTDSRRNYQQVGAAITKTAPLVGV
ncbi:Endoglucanase [Forsythia ovata]|uniref:cellulase n=1 Tax=Forsythia ovata TaxID=205694 RepID=A0ABD1X8K1_9LAMI